jgi:signal transduction histidine kinase
MFAPAERASARSVLRDAETLRPAAFAEQVVQVIPSILMILNRQRQVVYKNQRLMEFLGASSDRDILGKRPGELFHCIHAYENGAGCGTTEFCRECGAAKSILKSQKEQLLVTDECRVTTTSGDAYEFRVFASPHTFEGRAYTVFVVEDIREEKRRQALERTFFHDINNILNAIVGGSTLLGMAEDPESAAEFANMVEVAAVQLADEIGSHRRLLQAENHELSASISTVWTLELLRELVGFFAVSEDWRDRSVVIDETSRDVEIETDQALLHRVLGNMLKNALEATSGSDEVRIACARKGDSVEFSVHNPGSMPRSVQLQMFHRSFSTKGKGRGIGTYSMKLFGERYLKGNVWFSTSDGEGTTFIISVPISYEDD